jgi:hypothetical protein
MEYTRTKFIQLKLPKYYIEIFYGESRELFFD